MSRFYRYCLVQFFSHLFSNLGVVFVDGKKVAGVSLPIAAGTDVLEGLAHGHQEKKFYTLHLDMLVMQMDFPDLRGLPQMLRRSVPTEKVCQLRRSSGGNNWPHVQVEGADCCRCLDLPSSK